MANPQAIVDLTHQVRKLATSKIGDINDINREANFLALNALIEAARAGSAGRGFAVVANQVKQVSQRIGEVTDSLNKELVGSLSSLTALGEVMIGRIQSHEGQRCADLALNMIDIIDRNLYERSCDVRWWATDASLVACLADASAQASVHASQRLSVILDSYTVYKDIWVLDADGTIVASGRGEQYAVTGRNVARAPWFKAALNTASGEDYIAADVCAASLLHGAQVATYATAIREGGATHGKVLGALVIFFDWTPQAQAVVKGVRLSEAEWSRTRCMLLDSSFRVLASSDGEGVLSEVFPLHPDQRRAGFYRDGDMTVSFAATPGYETYKGLGWYGVVCQRADTPAGSYSR